MRTFVYSIAVAVLLVSPVAIRSAVAEWPSTTTYEPRVSIELGAKAYSRGGGDDNSRLVFDSVTNRTLLTVAEAIDQQNAAGTGMKLNFTTQRGRDMELRFVGASWDETNTAVSSNLASAAIPTLFADTGFVPDPLPPGFSPPAIPVDATSNFMPLQFQQEYESDYYSIELMARRNTQPGLTWMAGPRFVSIRENASFISTGTATTPAVLPALGTEFAAAARTNTDARNTLIGLQLGGEYNMPVSQDLYVQGFGRLAGFYNSTRGSQSIDSLRPSDAALASLTTTASVSGQVDNSTEAWLGEFGGRLYMDIIPNCVATYIGYEGVFIDSIALAPAQVNVVSTGQNHAMGETFFQAVTFGGKLTY